MSWIRILSLSLFLTTVSAVSHAGDLTTRDVVELQRSGLGDEVLVALIEVDGGPFDLSTADLIDLKAEGLSDRVLAALLRAGRHAVTAAPVPSDNPTHGDQAVATVYQDVRVVAFPVPIYVAGPRRKPGIGPGDGRVDSPGMTGRPTPGIARSRAVTVDSIRRAPPGFHPGNHVSRPVPARPAPSAQQAQPTPGVARSQPRSNP